MCWFGKPFVRLRQESAKGGACLLGETESFGGANEDLSENLHLFRVYGSPNGTDIVTVLPGDITHSLAANGRKWQEAAAAARVSPAHALHQM